MTIDLTKITTPLGLLDAETKEALLLMEIFIRLHMLPGQIVLDPFMGSGGTLVAAERLGRHGIGIEVDREHFETACRRVDEITRQPDLLISETRPAPVQEGFDL